MKLDTLGNDKLIILIDEFAQAIQNIKGNGTDGIHNAIHLLQSNRVLRQNTEINHKFQFVYTGSISLEGIARRLNCSSFINDLDIVRVSALNPLEGRQMTHKLLESVDFTMIDTVIEYMLKGIKYLNPLYIQLCIDKIRDISIEENLVEITEDIVNNAVLRIIQEENNKFESWHERLNIYSGNEYRFIIELLNIISLSQSRQITSNEIYNIATKYDLEDTHTSLINTLIDDGYINNIDNNKIYMFNSPILSMWWCKRIAN